MARGKLTAAVIALAVAPLLTACGHGDGNKGGYDPGPQAGYVANAHASARAGSSPCDAVGPVNDQMIATVGDARTWGPVARGENRYPGYANTDRLAVCLQPDGTAVGIFLKDGRLQVLWHQSPADKIRLPI
jgi:hypothetical protein